ncbi:hypothetical protein R80B4_01103 [Fibrobacteres bacterium R8-0-B4]
MQTDSLFYTIPTDVCERVDAEYRSWHQTRLPAELLIFLLSATSAKPVNYRGTFEGPDGIPEKMQWTISWAEKYGSPTLSTIRTFIALYRIWREVGFDSREIKFDMAAMVEGSGGNTKEQIAADLYLLFGVSIRHKNGGFGLFDSIAIGKTGGCVFASPALRYTVLNEGYVLDEWTGSAGS